MAKKARFFVEYISLYHDTLGKKGAAMAKGGGGPRKWNDRGVKGGPPPLPSTDLFNALSHLAIMPVEAPLHPGCYRRAAGGAGGGGAGGGGGGAGGAGGDGRGGELRGGMSTLAPPRIVASRLDFESIWSQLLIANSLYLDIALRGKLHMPSPPPVSAVVNHLKVSHTPLVIVVWYSSNSSV